MDSKSKIIFQAKSMLPILGFELEFRSLNLDFIEILVPDPEYIYFDTSFDISPFEISNLVIHVGTLLG